MAPPEPSRSRRPSTLILLGPTGVGKTTTIAKLAANYAFNLENRKKVALFTLDTYRIGAPAQLHQYAEIIEAKLEVLFESGDIVEARKRHVEKDVILVDTAGRCQKNADELRELKDLLSHFPDSKRYLVLSATTKFSDMQENVKRFGEVGFDQLIFTKVDETNSLGPLIALLYSSQKPLAYLTNGQNVPADFLEGSVSFFLDKIFSTPED
jgi:flagellar biosynthesis protein FlhF